MNKIGIPAADNRIPDPNKKLDADIKRKTRLVKQLRYDALIKVTVSIAAIFITFSYIFGISLAPTNDMFPAVHEGDLIIYYRPGRIINTDVVIYFSGLRRKKIILIHIA